MSCVLCVRILACYSCEYWIVFGSVPLRMAKRYKQHKEKYKRVHKQQNPGIMTTEQSYLLVFFLSSRKYSKYLISRAISVVQELSFGCFVLCFLFLFYICSVLFLSLHSSRSYSSFSFIFLQLRSFALFSGKFIMNGLFVVVLLLHRGK